VRLLHSDPKLGMRRLRLETPSDLWRVARMVRPGDRVGASTTRRDPEAPAEAKAAERERRRVWLVVRAEQIEFHGFGTQHVRVTGPIIEGPFDQGRHHTLDLGEGTELTLQKDAWTGGDEALLTEGREAAGEPAVVVAAVDWGESTVVRLRGRMVQPVAELRRTLPGKRYGGTGTEKARAEYRDEVAELLAREASEAAGLIVAGPGFFKEELAKAIAERAPALVGRLKVLALAESGSQGIQELLRSGAGSSVLRGSVAAEEAALVEALVTALGGGKRAAVGPVEVGEALQAGAVETLLVGESRLPEERTSTMLEAARTGRVRVFVVSALGEAGRRLDGLGGVGALLRFDWIPPGRLRRPDASHAPAATQRDPS
jgi:protein pelota